MASRQSGSRQRMSIAAAQVFKQRDSVNGPTDEEGPAVAEGRTQWNPRKSGIFKDEVIETLKKEDQDTLVESSQGKLFQVFLFCGVAIIGTLVPIATGFSKSLPEQYFNETSDTWIDCNPLPSAHLTSAEEAIKYCKKENLQYQPTVQVFVESSISLAIGVAMTAVLSGPEGLRKSIDPARLMMTAPISIGYAICDLIQLFAIGDSSASFFIVVSQLKLLGTAVMTLIIFRRNQSLVQWLLLIIITFTALLYCDMKARNDGKSLFQDAVVLYTLSLVVLKAVLGCGISVLLERAFKAAPDEPIWVNQVQLKVVSVPFTFLMIGVKGCYMCKKDRCVQDTGPFVNFFVLPVAFLILCQATQNFIVGLIYKKVNAIVKFLASAQSLWIAYLIEVGVGTAELYFGMILLIVMLMTEVISYAMAKATPAPPPPPAPKEPERGGIEMGTPLKR